MRARELGLTIGLLAPGDEDAITDVPGVLVGHTTLISGDGPKEPADSGQQAVGSEEKDKKG